MAYVPSRQRYSHQATDKNVKRPIGHPSDSSSVKSTTASADRQALQARDQNQTTAIGQSKALPKGDTPPTPQAPLNPPLKQLQIVLTLVAAATDENNRLHGLTEEVLEKVLHLWLQDQACGCYNYEDVDCHEIPVGCVTGSGRPRCSICAPEVPSSTFAVENNQLSCSQTREGSRASLSARVCGG